MTTLKSEDFSRTIQYSIPNNIHECDNNVNVVEMPFVVCSNRKDATLIQAKMGAYLSELIRKILKDD